MNAIVHRDYAQDQPTRVVVYSNRVEIWSPGGLSPGLTPDRFETGNAPPVWRNRSLAWVFGRLDLAQAEGQRIPTILRSMEKEGCPPPRFDVTDDSVQCVLPAHARHARMQEPQVIEHGISLGRTTESAITRPNGAGEARGEFRWQRRCPPVASTRPSPVHLTAGDEAGVPVHIVAHSRAVGPSGDDGRAQASRESMMADLQRQLLAFHRAIKIDDLDQNATLREKRDLLLEKLWVTLKRDFEAAGARPPTFDARNHGSHAMGTGVQPVDEDYDIDVALLFNLRASEHNPAEVKRWVAHALRGNTVELRRSCVTVWYQGGGERRYHVDFAVYSAPGWNPDGVARLARGFVGSDAANQVWEPADPTSLVRRVNERFHGWEQEQLRRVVRYLKRWSDVVFSARGNGAPVGIGITLAAYNGLRPMRAASTADEDDLAALRQLVDWMLSQFRTEWRGASYTERLIVRKPVVPHDNPFDRMSDPQMDTFRQRLLDLRTALDEARRLTDVDRAVEVLRRPFGEAFGA